MKFFLLCVIFAVVIEGFDNTSIKLKLEVIPEFTISDHNLNNIRYKTVGTHRQVG